ncbi:hypothetical protein CDL12_03648 [Handroanthus impetiginosus]|uniref:Uncharacterized protein n=1 Tax=Handroanthus impetiginosus TaxID=429701 RepID=A0A2G9I1G9_9LAMI|nr:hypothetical protein CDL12_03648 [Handroanthus impetiginosus]
MEERNDEEEKVDPRKGWDCGSPLYDAYELVSITNIIERHMMTTLPSGSTGFGSSPIEFSEKENGVKKKKEKGIIFHKRWKNEKGKGIKSRFCRFF